MNDISLTTYLLEKINRYAYALGRIEGAISTYRTGGNKEKDIDALVRHIEDSIETLRKELEKINGKEKMD